MTPHAFAVVGNGWRAGFYYRVARALPGLLRVTGIAAESPDHARRASAEHGVPAYGSVAELLAADSPEFVVVCVPRTAAPSIVRDLVTAETPVLLETPPTDDLDGLRALWREVGASGLVQVAEQYLRYPGHAARKAIVDRGTIGRPTSVQVSSTHEYHAVALIRGLIGVGFASARVRASEFAAPLVDPVDRGGWRDDDREQPASTVLATIDFGGAMGLYDFTSNQWHNPLRHRRIVVRGSRGEIVDDRIVRLADSRTVLASPIVRRQIGYDLDLDGYATDHLTFEGEPVWRNAFPGTRLSDEELAIAEMLTATGAWARGAGPASYPPAEACQDLAITLAIREALKSDGPVTVGDDLWVP